MIDLKDMRVLVTLARHKNFSQAAEDCGISQPAFSARLRTMEDALGTAIVRRGNKFLGFTAEGEILLRWSQKILADTDRMHQEVQMIQGGLRGRLVLGAVPTAVPFAATLASDLRKQHTEMTIEIQTMSSSQIADGLTNYALDAGVTYTENLPAAFAVLQELYEEHYVLLAPKAMAPRTKGTATWAEAAALPLCLLTKTMRNRRYIDEAFATAGVTAVPVMETNGFTASLTQVATGTAATITPAGWAKTIPLGRDAVSLELNKPSLTHAIGLVQREGENATPALSALQQSALRSL